MSEVHSENLHFFPVCNASSQFLVISISSLTPLELNIQYDMLSFNAGHVGACQSSWLLVKFQKCVVDSI